MKKKHFLLPDESFSKDGYLIDQGKLTDLPFGKYPSSRNGCAWVAAWNLCQFLNRNKKTAFPADEISAERICQALSRTLLFGGKTGVHIFVLFFYLRFIKRIPLRMRISLRSLASKKCYSGGILMYHTGCGFHYTTFLKQPAGKYRFLNGVYGIKEDIRSMRAFLAKESNFPLVLMLTL